MSPPRKFSQLALKVEECIVKPYRQELELRIWIVAAIDRILIVVMATSMIDNSPFPIRELAKDRTHNMQLFYAQFKATQRKY